MRQRLTFRESDLKESVERFLKRSHKPLARCDAVVRELKLRDGRFDVVGYSRPENTFYVVECKRGTRADTIGRAFGQILVYQSLISNRGKEFREKFLERLLASKVRLKRTMARDIVDLFRANEVPFRFFVALTDTACRSHSLIRLMRDGLRNKVGIIRFDGRKCKNYISTDVSRHDYDICESEPIGVPLIDLIDQILERLKASKEIVNIIRELKTAVEKLPEINVRERSGGFVYRTNKNFLYVHIRKKGITAALFKRKGKLLQDPARLLSAQRKRQKWVHTKMINSSRIIGDLVKLIKLSYRVTQK